jgi:SPP1 family predicted phage head-tail adaptor
MINPAQLRNEIQLARASATVDGFGQPVNTWPVYYTTWASIRQLSGQELYQSDEFTSAAQVRIVMRWPGGAGITVQTGDRIFFQTHTYVVQIANDVEMRNIVLELTCLEIDGTS